MELAKPSGRRNIVRQSCDGGTEARTPNRALRPRMRSPKPSSRGTVGSLGRVSIGRSLGVLFAQDSCLAHWRDGHPEAGTVRLVPRSTEFVRVVGIGEASPQLMEIRTECGEIALRRVRDRAFRNGILPLLLLDTRF